MWSEWNLSKLPADKRQFLPLFFMFINKIKNPFSGQYGVLSYSLGSSPIPSNPLSPLAAGCHILLSGNSFQDYIFFILEPALCPHIWWPRACHPHNLFLFSDLSISPFGIFLFNLVPFFLCLWTFRLWLIIYLTLLLFRKPRFCFLKQDN